MPRVVRRLEERLRAVNKDNLEQAYEALKNYLMIYTPDKFDADSFKAYVGVDWDAALERTLAPEQRQALDEHLDAMLTHGAPPPAVPMDKNLVAGVRDMLVAFPLEYRVFSRLKRAQIGADIPPFTRGGRGRSGVAQRLRARQRRAAHQGHPGPVHQGGLSQGVRDLGRQGDPPARLRGNLGARPAADGREQVAADRQGEPGARPTGCAACTSRSTSRSGTSTSPTCAWSSSTASTRACRSRASSPASTRRWRAFLRGVARETTLVEPKPEVGSTSGTKVGNVDQKADAGQARDGGGARQGQGAGRRDRADGAAAREDGRRSLRADPPPRRRHAAADGRDHEDVQRRLRAARGDRCGAEEQVGAASRRRRRAHQGGGGAAARAGALGAREGRRRGRRPRARRSSARA